MNVVLLENIGRLVTGTAEGTVRSAALVLKAGSVAWVGGQGAQPPPDLRSEIDEAVDLGGGLVTPGLIDAHTHPVYAGTRLPEIAARTAGLGYADLDAESGISATVAATRGASREELETAVRRRLSAMIAQGTTTIEAKTGYHLDRTGELGDIETLRRLDTAGGMPRIHVTFLAAHAVPAESRDDPDGFIDEAASWSMDAAGAGADACDVFCDAGYFSVAQSRRVLTAGRDAGLQVRIHADELAHSGGAELAAELGAASADHLLHVTAADASALAAAGVVATLCPSTALSIGRTPDVTALRDAGVTIALGSDHNPGTSGITSMSLVVALAVWGLGLSVDEALWSATAGGAQSLGRRNVGCVRQGARGDIVAWDADHEGAFAWAWGLDARRVWRGGEEIVWPTVDPDAEQDVA